MADTHDSSFPAGDSSPSGEPNVPAEPRSIDPTAPTSSDQPTSAHAAGESHNFAPQPAAPHSAPLPGLAPIVVGMGADGPYVIPVLAEIPDHVSSPGLHRPLQRPVPQQRYRTPYPSRRVA